jgi:hypothetical protein
LYKLRSFPAKVAEQAGTGGNAGIGARVGLKILAASVTVADQAAAPSAA